MNEELPSDSRREISAKPFVCGLCVVVAARSVGTNVGLNVGFCGEESVFIG
jgi:hypothetical protein